MQDASSGQLVSGRASLTLLSTHQTFHPPAELGKDQVGGHLLVGGGLGGVGK